jgi:hypothetical protein
MRLLLLLHMAYTPQRSGRLRGLAGKKCAYPARRRGARAMIAGGRRDPLREGRRKADGRANHLGRLAAVHDRCPGPGPQLVSPRRERPIAADDSSHRDRTAAAAADWPGVEHSELAGSALLVAGALPGDGSCPQGPRTVPGCPEAWGRTLGLSRVLEPQRGTSEGCCASALGRY